MIIFLMHFAVAVLVSTIILSIVSIFVSRHFNGAIQHNSAEFVVRDDLIRDIANKIALLVAPNEIDFAFEFTKAAIEKGSMWRTLISRRDQPQFAASGMTSKSAMLVVLKALRQSSAVIAPLLDIQASRIRDTLRDAQLPESTRPPSSTSDIAAQTTAIALTALANALRRNGLPADRAETIARDVIVELLVTSPDIGRIFLRRIID